MTAIDERGFRPLKIGEMNVCDFGARVVRHGDGPLALPLRVARIQVEIDRGCRDRQPADLSRHGAARSRLVIGFGERRPRRSEQGERERQNCNRERDDPS